jgi:hypothetical protein
VKGFKCAHGAGDQDDGLAKMLVNHNRIKIQKTIQFGAFLVISKPSVFLRRRIATIFICATSIDVQSDLIAVMLRCTVWVSLHFLTCLHVAAVLNKVN